MVPVQTNGLHPSDKVFTEDKELYAAFENWMRWDKNPKTSIMLQNLADRGDEEQLRKLLMKRLQFGTAGLRGRMQPGTMGMNDLVIIQTSQGLANYVAKMCDNGSGSRLSAIIGYDGRHGSLTFAKLTALAFINQGFKVYLTSKVCPTPFVPFGVKYLECNVGVMVTASHNPKEDNGYKVYWGNAAQITPPHDKGIQKSIMEHLKPVPNAWDLNLVNYNYDYLEDPLSDIESEYYGEMVFEVEQIGGAGTGTYQKTVPVKFTYTAMHGVGYRYVAEGLRACQIKRDGFVVVEEQKDPNPDFPTVKFPNPEEGKSALTLAMKYADENNSPIILANDPDADRLAVAEKLPSGEWKIFNGNELGSLLGWWYYTRYMERPERAKPADCYMIASTVSSKFLKTMAEAEGFNFVETLTGFKWMGNKAVDLIAGGKTVLFAFEEAIGFMVGTAVLDKDGVSALVYCAQMATILYKQGITLNEQLQLLYKKYGYHVSHNSYYICYEPEIINKVFENIRNFSSNNGCVGYPIGLMDNKYKVISVRDLTTGYDSEEPDQKAILPTSKSSHMITFKFDNGLVLTLRTSGTEPKVKYYSELRAAPGCGDRNEVQKNLDDMINAMVNEWLLPEKWGLTPRSD